MINNNSIIASINNRSWWHSPPADKGAYKKRGIFFASSYKECEFYGRPLDETIKVNVKNPLVGVEEDIIRRFFGIKSKQMMVYRSLIDGTATNVLNMRFQLDKELFRVAKNSGYDAIAIVTSKGYETTKTGKLPRSVELNVFDVLETALISRKETASAKK